MDENIKQNLSRGATWMRVLYMLLLAIFYSLAEVVLSAVVVFQLLLVLFTGKKNDRLLKFGQALSTYIYQVLSFQTFNTETLPYPFTAWPKGEPKPRVKEAALTTEGTE